MLLVPPPRNRGLALCAGGRLVPKGKAFEDKALVLTSACNPRIPRASEKLHLF